ncbi:type I polyketide synthase [Leptolyngbya sp. FACHB-261]|uniref:type I polyketide synthase n=1 Tax=Leptolyngbya sp. FACHB-261 TaxID=2692806 RepID=UPI001685C7E8|nr:type I polyketide synthase [Leptolyngbya sp. FACHB-261]MBD2103367.1 thioester reductase domain-containing protein [Leptolyngbya sp. FACHB-261]
MEPIAVIGLGCRFPGAKDPESFWQLLRDGVDAITEVPKERWDIDAYYDPAPGTPGKMSTRWGGFIERVDQFEPSFFGISPREVERMDPQQRLVLEVAWEALENAGLAPDKIAGTPAGVFMAIGNYDYCRLLTQDLNLVNAYDGTGNTLCIAANRLSYILNLRGPSVVIETACSSSLVALHYACQSLQSGESSLCLVGGVSLMLSPEPTITYSHAHMMASDGRCKTFDASADGYVRGEGCGVVVLKRLSDALKDKDNVLAVVKGTAVNQDGLSNGLTAPNGPSQQAVVRQALQNAGVTPDQISYIEAHGTGTSLGDPIEVKSLKAVLMQDRKPDQPCWLGSVKTNIGHLEAASGMAGLIKVVLALQHQEIPPHLHLKQLNSLISLDGTTFEIPSQRQPWSVGEAQRLAGISAFGFGGTNCHAILEEAPEVAPELAPEDRPYHLLMLSAKTENALKELAQRYADFCAAHPEASLADICFTANTTRAQFDHRLAVVAESGVQLREQLEAFAAGREPGGLVTGQANNKKRSKIAFLFTGQGSQFVGMGHQLYETQPVFRQALDRCDAILRPYLQKPLLAVLYPEGTDTQASAKNGSLSTPGLLGETAYTQPALFALEYALFQLWKSWGIEPTIVMGHSVGEYVAACVAGVFSLEDGLKLIAERGRLMQALPAGGEMVAVFASEAQVTAAIQAVTAQLSEAQAVSIAAINGPQSVVISGQSEAVQAVLSALKAEGIKAKKLQVSHAFHSPLMEPMLSAFKQVAASVVYAAPRTKLISNVTGALATAEITTPEYWCDHVRSPVRFADSMQALQQQKYEIFVEIGPRPTLLGMGRYCLPDGVGVWLPSLYPGQADWQQMLQSLGALYVRGAAVDWASLDQDAPRRRLQLPTYPFQRQRYWVEFAENGQATTSPTTQNSGQDSGIQTPIMNLIKQGDTQQLAQQLETTGELSELELKALPKLLELLIKQNQQQLTTASVKEALKDWLYEIEWQAKPSQLKNASENGAVQPGSWLLLADKGGVGQALSELLKAQGHSCILVDAQAADKTDFERLFQEDLATLDLPLQGVIHLWSLDAAAELSVSTLEQAQALGVGSALRLLQALAKRPNETRFSQIAQPRLWFVTRGVVTVGSSRPDVAQSPLWGLGKVVALEHPEFWGGMVDLAPSIPQTTDNQITGGVTTSEAAHLLTELTHAQGEDHLAFRAGQRYVARLVRKQLPNSTGVTFSAEGSYLVTGGLGALGLKVAQWMVAQGARQLVLTSRRGASAEVQATLSQLEKAGARVLVAQADVASEGDMVKLLETIQTSMSPLRGIVHAAGVPGYEALKDMAPDTLNAVLRPKVVGTWLLHQLTQGLKLDFFVSFSSISSVWGSKGQAHYAAANYFLDGLAHYRHSLGLPALSVNWGPWAGGGMALEEFQVWLTRMGVEALQPEQATAALGYLLGAGCAQATVANVDWSLFKGLYEARGKRSLLEQVEGQTHKAIATTSEAAPRSEMLQRLEAVPAQERQALLTTHLQTEAAKVLKLAQLPDPQQSLFDLGMDSLMAVELVSLIRTQLGAELPISEFMQASSIAALTALLLKQFAPDITPIEVVTQVLNLHDEAVLEAAIRPESAQAIPTKVNSILLTGATGFLGAFLLNGLLEQTKAEVYCLVRAADAGAGMQKIQKNLSSYGLWQSQHRFRIIPVVGDLAKPRLGLSTEQFDELAHKIDVIYHNGAVLNFVYPYSTLKPTNVLGTQEILRLACQSKVKPLHYVSTDAVFDSSAYYGREVLESEPILHTDGIDLGYTQTKWVAEKLVTVARERGLPVAIYRPPLIAGDSQTGLWNTDDFTCRFLKGCIQMGSMPNMNCGITLVPVDYVSRAIVQLSQQQESLGKSFHLNNPNFSSWAEVTGWINELGYPIREIDYEDWEIELSKTLGSGDNALSGLLPFFLRRWSDEQLTFAGLGQRRVKLNCQQTVAQLVGSSVSCPRVDAKLLKTYFSYLVRSGFLEAPLVRA